MSQSPSVIVWFRRDLRLSDNPALAKARESGAAVVPLYIHDEAGEGDWPDGGASRWWLHRSLTALQSSLREMGSRLILAEGASQKVLLELCQRLSVSEVYWNRRYEPAVVQRDTAIKKALAAAGVQARSFNGSLLQSPLKIVNKSGLPFKVFTPFWKHIRNLDTRALRNKPQSLHPPAKWPTSLAVDSLQLLPKLDWDAGFHAEWKPGEEGAKAVLASFKRTRATRYPETRDQPAIDGVSKLSPHLHFGEISPLQIWRSLSLEEHEPYLRQLGWREFSHHLLYHFPDTPSEPLRPEFRSFPWKRDEPLLRAWQKGRTGFPIVDAGMRQLWATGWMHNRVRMIAASLLVKHLLQPWQEGAAWFWDTLVDADLANNTMGWQWVAGCGADAAPYFRIFNPITQGQRFDPTGAYTRKWVPELRDLPDEYLFEPWEAPPLVLQEAGVTLGRSYPEPIVSHKRGREAALEAYRKLKDEE